VRIDRSLALADFTGSAVVRTIAGYKGIL